MLAVCATKLTGLTESNDDNELLQDAVASLSKTNHAALSETQIDACCRIIQQSFDQNNGVAFGLLFLRILVLQYSADDALFLPVADCLEWVVSELTKDASASVLLSPSARSAAWLTCANAIGSHGMSCVVEMATLVDAAISDSSSSNAVPVRQAACAVLYNVALCLKDDLNDDMNDLQTALVCSTLAFVDEADGICRLRRLMTMGRVLKPTTQVNVATKALLSDLGVVESLSQIVVQEDGGADHAKSRDLASELMQLLAES